MITFGHVIDFILKNRGTGCYKGVSKQQIEKDVWRAWHDNCFLYETDEYDNITGWLQYEVNKDTKQLFVYQNIAMSLGRLNRFLKEFFVQYPSYQLIAMRHGHEVVYDTNKLLTKLSYYERRSI